MIKSNDTWRANNKLAHFKSNNDTLMMCDDETFMAMQTKSSNRDI